MAFHFDDRGHGHGWLVPFRRLRSIEGDIPAQQTIVGMSGVNPLSIRSKLDTQNLGGSLQLCERLTFCHAPQPEGLVL